MAGQKNYSQLTFKVWNEITIDSFSRVVAQAQALIQWDREEDNKLDPKFDHHAPSSSKGKEEGV